MGTTLGPLTRWRATEDAAPVYTYDHPVRAVVFAAPRGVRAQVGVWRYTREGEVTKDAASYRLIASLRTSSHRRSGAKLGENLKQ